LVGEVRDYAKFLVRGPLKFQITANNPHVPLVEPSPAFGIGFVLEAVDYDKSVLAGNLDQLLYDRYWIDRMIDCISDMGHVERVAAKVIHEILSGDPHGSNGA
jgi:hypothetical protein